MASRIGLVTDSSSQITPDLVDRFVVEVVPLTITIDDTDHLEGIDLGADEFYGYFDDDAAPEVSTSQPAPGRFADAYRRLVDRGCTEIVSIHIAAAMSGTVGSAAVAAAEIEVPIRVIDTGSASFGVAVCTWAAGVAIARGANADDIERRVAALVPRIGTAFMIGVPHLAERGGRTPGIDLDVEGIPVVAMCAGEIDVLAEVSTIDDTIDVMSTYAADWCERVGGTVTVAVGTADAPSRPLAARLRAALSDAPGVDGVVDYRVGPSVGAHTGPGTFGLFVFPTIK